MKITSAEFLKSALNEADWPRDPMPEVAFLGRSNVGKSSLINSLLGVRGLARTSSTPGRTQALKAIWSTAAEEYLAKREQLVLSIHIVDSRPEPSKQDLQLHEWLVHHRKPHLIVATKSDKLSKRQLTQNISRATGAFKGTNLITYSATKRQGREQLWSAIEKSLKS